MDYDGWAQRACRSGLGGSEGNACGGTLETYDTGHGTSELINADTVK